ncbi:MAG: 30S ribosomal protein S12 methylthiotransferase RimO [Desulfovibrio sp.]|jgi:tRNA-2-methylthio-N6-dimethylallyladenosine synthase/ribosomal protein S12 methylthiotransferase|nr:30S ribosomal protein S12 methylthiotransferase RimO [Desulfovibrio sp.]
MLKIYSISLGCPKNRVDTEQALGFLGRGANLKTVAAPGEADLVFINTCAFIGPAVEESVRRTLETIEETGKFSEGRRPLLAMAGCLVGRFGEKTLAPDLPEIDLFLDNKDLDSWGTRIGAALSRRGLKPALSPRPRRLLSTGPAYAWLKIGDGCDRSCAFCTIPAIRGPGKSRAVKDLTAEARSLLRQGVRELNLVAQDLTAYGRDLGMKHGLRSLLERLLPLPGLARLRLLYLYPSGLDAELLAFLRSAGPPFVPYFDLPLQHVSPEVLKRMGRSSSEEPAAIVDRIRSLFPDAALRATLIAGFPGETPADFDCLLRFVEETRFTHLGVFAYEAEEGTRAALLSGQIPRKEKESRRDELLRIQSGISAEILAGCVGKRFDFLVDAPHEEWPGLHVGRTWFQAPEIDGITYISGPGVSPGALLEAEVVEATAYDLTALAPCIA